VARKSSEEKIQHQVQTKAGAQAAWSGDGTLFGEPILVVNQKTKIIELTNEYSVFDAAGNRVGGVTQVGQSMAKKALRFVSNVDQFMTHKLEIHDAEGTPVLNVTRPRKFLKSRVIVERPSGEAVGEIVQRNAFGKIKFGLEVDGEEVGEIRAENWRAWNFAIVDPSETEVARITKTFEGVARTLFTTADHYVLHVHQPLQEPLRSLVVAASLSVDTALKQDDRGLS
jgi:uncharacterized protein YxjI